jgi:hypothetical protein
MRTVVVVAVLALMVGVGAGYWVRGQMIDSHLSRSDVAPPSVLAGTRQPEAPALPVKVAEANPGFMPAPVASTSDTVDLLHRLVALQKDHLLGFHVQVIGFDHHLTNEARTLLKISEGEAAILDREADRIAQRLGELETRHAGSRMENGKLVISIPAFPGEGGKLYDELMATYASTLGAERNELVQQLIGADFGGSFHGFGLEKREITIERAPPDSNFTRYVVTDVRMRAPGVDGSGGLTMKGGGRFHGRSDLVSVYGAVAEKFLPPDF